MHIAASITSEPAPDDSRSWDSVIASYPSLDDLQALGADEHARAWLSELDRLASEAERFNRLDAEKSDYHQSIEQKFQTPATLSQDTVSQVADAQQQANRLPRNMAQYMWARMRGQNPDQDARRLADGLWLLTQRLIQGQHRGDLRRALYELGSASTDPTFLDASTGIDAMIAGRRMPLEAYAGLAPVAVRLKSFLSAKLKTEGIMRVLADSRPRRDYRDYEEDDVWGIKGAISTIEDLPESSAYFLTKAQEIYSNIPVQPLSRYELRRDLEGIVNTAYHQRAFASREVWRRVYEIDMALGEHPFFRRHSPPANTLEDFGVFTHGSPPPPRTRC